MNSTNLRHAILLGLLASASTGHAATAAWQLGAAQPARQLSMAGVRAQQIVVDPGLRPEQAETLSFALFDRNVSAHRTRFEAFSGGWTWSGRIDGQAGHFVVLTSADGNLAGMISSHEGSYEIRPQGVGVASLIEVDATKFPACGGAIDTPPALPLATPLEPVQAIEAPAGSVVSVDVMIFYSNNLLTALGGEAQVRAQAQAAVAASNTSFINSDMTTRFNLVAVLRARSRKALPAPTWAPI